MSVHLPPRDAHVDAVPESGSESSASDDDQAFSDWASDGGAGAPCTSLFEPKTLPSAREARAWDAAQHGFDLDAIARRLSACGLRSAGEC
jgi:protein arginine N-methyltransferase 3